MGLWRLQFRRHSYLHLPTAFLLRFYGIIFTVSPSRAIPLQGQDLQQRQLLLSPVLRFEDSAGSRNRTDPVTGKVLLIDKIVLR